MVDVAIELKGGKGGLSIHFDCVDSIERSFECESMAGLRGLVDRVSHHAFAYTRTPVTQYHLRRSLPAFLCEEVVSIEVIQPQLLTVI